MSYLIEFYKNGSKNYSGVTLKEIINFTDKQWEENHDFIQWVFPLKEKSKYNPDAPTLTDYDINQFKTNEELRSNVYLVIARAELFFGMYSSFKPDWFDSNNHNVLRITRILKFLNMVNFGFTAHNITKWLEYLNHTYSNSVSDNTLYFWQLASQKS